MDAIAAGGAQVVVAKDGEAALEYLDGVERESDAHHTGLPRVILFELRLPKVSGRELLRCLKADVRFRHVPAVVFTASADGRDSAECFRLGANSYIVKPTTVEDYRRVAAQVAHYWLSCNSVPEPT